ncbi:hypothetical protein BT63DRAFT_423221 [Microthyrium microscopicum]|uniref:PXA domain-containing protein n=1 Tax=Microthyrium microscopicum TaxID=703497 RepID=A0A6A6UF99_9PEZI|nr:hypothetical protein BT63DRAFT_423221 [Microthyrium microscopicum]
MSDIPPSEPVPTLAPSVLEPPQDDTPISPLASDAPISKPDHPPPSLQETAQSFTDQALQFLSTASNETIGACLVGLGATTYFVLGRVGLVLMGVVGGVVLHATWEGHESGAANAENKAREERRRREIGLDIVKRTLTWGQHHDQEAEEIERLDRVEVVKGKKLDYSEFRAETRMALDEFTDAAIRDYVKWWYSPMLPQELRFPDACRQTLTAFLLSLSNHLYRKRPANVFVDFATHSTSILIVFLNELTAAVTLNPNTSTQEAIELYLEAKPECNLRYLVDSENQLRKLDLVADDVLETFLDHKTYNCEFIRVFLREIVSKVCLDWSIQNWSRAEYINDWIVYLLEDPPAEAPKEEMTSKGTSGKAKTSSEASDSQHEETESPEQLRHKRVVSKAQEAMDDAMREAARLTQMIAEEEAKKTKDEPPATGITISKVPGSVRSDDASESTTQGVYTPTSSHSDGHHSDNSPPVSIQQPKSKAEQPVDLPVSEERPAEPKRMSTFTTFDQLVQGDRPTALLEEEERKKREPPPLTLHLANILIMDDSDPNDKSTIRNKPPTEYMIQIEPATTYYPGWMIFRRYNDFEALHERIVRIAKVTGAQKFSDSHPTLPLWKGTTKAKLRDDLERYLLDAVQHPSIADSQALKEFAQKDNAVSKAPQKQGFGLGAIENVGKGMVDVFSQAPKGVATGGKAILGGVNSVLGAGKTPKKNSITSSPALNRSQASISTPSLSRADGVIGVSASARQSQDSLRAASPIVDTQPAPIAQMERRPSSIRESISEKSKIAPMAGLEFTPVLSGDQIINLPPPPTSITDDYEIRPKDTPSRQSVDGPPRYSTSTTNSSHVDLLRTTVIPEEPASKPARPAQKPLSEKETHQAVELGLASITELYKLSSAWSVRLTLLNAAKTILLRPGNAQLDSIRQLLQDTLLDANTSDAGLATHIQTLRANTLPTEAERATWPAERTPEQREELRAKARKLLLERGMPQALNSVMGQAASAEALGRVFDALQVQTVARGLVFGLALQALRAITQ